MKYTIELFQRDLAKAVKVTTGEGTHRWVFMVMPDGPAKNIVWNPDGTGRFENYEYKYVMFGNDGYINTLINTTGHRTVSFTFADVEADVNTAINQQNI